MVDLSRKFDVLVIGGGNAALCAAISARRAGASVLVLEGAPKFYRGGNTRHTRNMRCAHDAATEILTGPYTEEEFWDDLLAFIEEGRVIPVVGAELLMIHPQNSPGIPLYRAVADRLETWSRLAFEDMTDGVPSAAGGGAL